MDNRAELVIQALQERIGQLVSQYETHIALLRAEITQLQQTQNTAEPEEK
jgi:hypothetical protein